LKKGSSNIGGKCGSLDTSEVVEIFTTAGRTAFETASKLFWRARPAATSFSGTGEPPPSANANPGAKEAPDRSATDRKKEPVKRRRDFPDMPRVPDFAIENYLILVGNVENRPKGRIRKDPFILSGEGLVDDVYDFLLFERFWDQVNGSGRERLHPEVLVSESREENNGNPGLVLPDLFQKIHPSPFRHPDIGKDKIHRTFFKKFEGESHGRSRPDLKMMTPKDFCQKVQSHVVVLDDKDRPLLRLSLRNKPHCVFSVIF
jgi:hypothetical protein